jgi:hypothetical protein
LTGSPANSSYKELGVTGWLARVRRAFMRDPSTGKLFPALLAILLVVGAGLVLIRLRPARSPSAPSTGQIDPMTQALANQLTALEARENQMDDTVWAKELLAQRCGLVMESLWDALNAATNGFGVLASFPIGEIIAPQFKAPQTLGCDVRLREFTGSGISWTADQWRLFLREREGEGWQIAQTEFRHNRFDVDSAGQPRQSTYYFAAHLTNASRTERAILQGELLVDWAASPTPDGLPQVKRVDAGRLSLKMRRGEPTFLPILDEAISPPDKSFFIDPLLLYDLDGDGLSEIILTAKNLVFRRLSNGHFVSEQLCRHSPGLIFTGVIADFDRDGVGDFLCAKFEGLVLFKGSPQGTFDQPGKLVWAANPHLKYGQVLTCGDIDLDGDLDVWLGQYKVPYDLGQMPAPYYDANDGNPSYLLLNDGQGNFHDATAAAGLAGKRLRRSYSGSFVDLDADGDLDLLIVSDFAGLELYQNDGRGHFAETTREWISEGHGFGMAHALADFDTDGGLDMLMIAMNSPTADRLNHLGLERLGSGLDQAMRRRMTFGNRLYLGRPGKPAFQQTSMNDAIARSGWSWGCSAFDLDNDSFPDVYIANGHTSQRSVREYEPQFWLHDIYVGGSKHSVVVNAYFGSKFSRTRGRELSYGGHEKNRLYLNQRGESFVEIGHLMGVALEQDSRNVVADDLDGDGRMDLLVTTFEVWPELKQTLRVFRNTLEDGGNWIGFRLREQGAGISPAGARVTLRHAGGVTTRQIVTGDSYRSQHANTVHFGLGKISQVESVEIRWTNGRSLVLRQPAINQYHAVRWSEPKATVP